MIDGLFALLNTALLGAVFWYLYRRVLYDRIQHMQLLEHATHLNNMKRQESLRKQEQSLVRAYYHQHYRYEELSKKIELWRRQLELLEQQQHEQQEQLADVIQRARSLRDQYLVDRALCAAAMDKALLGVSQELEHVFADPQQGDAYVRAVLAVQRCEGDCREES
jgi:hypothetical protein